MNIRTLLPRPKHEQAPDEETGAIGQKPVLVRWLTTGATGVLFIDMALVAFFSIVSSGHVFWTGQNLTAQLLGLTEPLLLALGLVMLLGAGRFDLSLGANLVLSSVVGAEVMLHISAPGDVTLSILAGLAACIATGAVYGAVNGLVIAYLGVNSLIATLGTTGIGTGLALLITNGADLSGIPNQVQAHFGLLQLGPVPVSALMALVIAFVLWAVVRYTRFGLETIAIGSSGLAAERAGLNVRRHVLRLAILAGSLAGLAGFCDLARYLSTTINGHANDALAAFTAIVIGGNLLEGGRIRIMGVLWGTVLAIVLLSGLVVLGAQSFYQLIAIGIILIIAVAIDRFRFRRLERS